MSWARTRVSSRFAVAKHFWYFLCFLDKKFSVLEFLAWGKNQSCLYQPHTEHSTHCSTQVCFLHHSPLTSLLLILSHSLLSFIPLTPFLVRALELSGAKRVFSQSTSGSQWDSTLPSPPKSTSKPTLSGAEHAQGSSELLQPGWELLQPFPQGWAVLTFQSFSM